MFVQDAIFSPVDIQKTPKIIIEYISSFLVYSLYIYIYSKLFTLGTHEID